MYCTSVMIYVTSRPIALRPSGGKKMAKITEKQNLIMPIAHLKDSSLWTERETSPRKGSREASRSSKGRFILTRLWDEESNSQLERPLGCTFSLLLALLVVLVVVSGALIGGGVFVVVYLQR